MMRAIHRHTWRCLLAAMAMVLFSACALAQSAVIDNGSDPAAMLNLRAQPDKGASVLGRFFSGTKVSILSDEGNGWSRIALGEGGSAVTGYVMTQYLGDHARTDATRSARVTSPYGTQSVVLRDRPSNSYGAVAMLMVGDSVLVIGEMDEFCYVRTGSGCVGCLLESELE